MQEMKVCEHTPFCAHPTLTSVLWSSVPSAKRQRQEQNLVFVTETHALSCMSFCSQLVPEAAATLNTALSSLLLWSCQMPRPVRPHSPRYHVMRLYDPENYSYKNRRQTASQPPLLPQAPKSQSTKFSLSNAHSASLFLTKIMKF